MCGIVGVVTKNSNGFLQPQLNAFSDLLFMDTLRGPDSTGVFMVDRDGNVDMLKEKGPSWELLTESQYDSIVEKKGYQSGKALVGHNRKATVGKISEENAHPFTVNDEFVLVHNGSLPSHKHLGHEADVDSHAVAKYLHDKWRDDLTPEETAKILEHLGGAWALVWYDLRFNKLNIVRNYQRPLSMVETSDSFFFASELDMLQAGLSRNNIKAQTVLDIKPLVLYTINLEEKSSKVTEVVLPTETFFPTKATKTTGKAKVIKSGGQTTCATGCEDDDTDALSKSAFKKFLKKVIGRSISFYVEDFVEINKNDPDNFYFYGGCHEYTFNHEIVGVSDALMATKVLDNYSCAQGKIVDAEYIKERRLVKLRVEITGVQELESTFIN